MASNCWCPDSARGVGGGACRGTARFRERMYGPSADEHADTTAG